MFRRAVLIVGFAGLLGLIAGGGFLAWLHAGYTRPGPLAADAAVIVPKGAGLSEIASALHTAGVIADARTFRLAVRMWAGDKPLRAGEFLISAGASARDVARTLQEGKTVVRRLTIAEGLTTAEVLARLAETEGLFGPTPSGIGEGELLPETYHFSYGDARADVVARMRAAMDGLLAELWARRDRALPLRTAREALVLASIVEKETGVAAERPRVAAVFVNRLRKGMRLQSDPTVLYGITQGEGPLDRALTRADLRAPTPYNTYVIDGLPPTPIANPGRAAIAAVLSPADTDDLYFVADGTGGHAFAKTLKQHNRNVAKWRKLQRESGRDGDGAPDASN